MAAPALALLWADQSETAALRSGPQPRADHLWLILLFTGLVLKSSCA